MRNSSQKEWITRIIQEYGIQVSSQWAAAMKETLQAYRKMAIQGATDRYDARTGQP